jgi:hypothetical protein
MSTVIVTVATTSTPFPSGTVPAGIVISLSGDSVPSQTITSAPYTASFSDVAPGSYTASAQAVDHAGNPLGAAATSAEFTVAAPVMVDVPQTVSVTVQ